ncbi:hypothetical protein RRG08_034918 [Elysia crispata]|uniref:Uncharacterized protein n=1 Tax=Elysia crispata TaxID=231223 RepID=A0AAE0YQT0_9GAST|nr:hypothetical protein RRG08_034918 [Elysia crispata]
MYSASAEKIRSNKCRGITRALSSAPFTVSSCMWEQSAANGHNSTPSFVSCLHNLPPRTMKIDFGRFAFGPGNTRAIFRYKLTGCGQCQMDILIEIQQLRVRLSCGHQTMSVVEILEPERKLTTVTRHWTPRYPHLLSLDGLLLSV